MNTIFFKLTGICFIALCLSCSEYLIQVDGCSCFDPECDCYIAPQFFIENISVDGNDVTLNWESPDSVNLTFFSYRYDYENSFYEGYLGWQEIGENIQQFTLDNLFDGDYHVEILGRYYSEHEDSTAVAMVDFNLNFLQDYSISLFPHDQTAVVNDTIEIFLTIPRIDNIIGYQIDLLYEPEILEIYEVNIDEGNLIESFPGSVFLPEIIDNLIRIHILMVEGNSPLDEDGSLAKLIFSVKSPGETDIIISNSSTLRDIDNNEIAIDTLYNCSVTILE